MKKFAVIIYLDWEVIEKVITGFSSVPEAEIFGENFCKNTDKMFSVCPYEEIK